MSVVDLRAEQLSREDILSRLKRLKPGEVLTLICAEDPQSLLDDLRSVHSGRWDVQKMYRTRTDGAWVLYAKRSRGGSS